MKLRPSDRHAISALLGLALSLALAGCASRTSGTGTVAATAPPSTGWTEDHLIQQNQLLPNGLRPLRYFYW